MTNGGEVCRGDRMECVEDLFRLLQRGREYLVEADRQLRGGGTADEQAASAVWYADMDANDEWTGFDAEAHAACVHDIILAFEDNIEFVRRFDGKAFLIDGMWQKLKVSDSLVELCEGAPQIEMRIAAVSSKQ